MKKKVIREIYLIKRRKFKVKKTQKNKKTNSHLINPTMILWTKVERKKIKRK